MGEEPAEISRSSVARWVVLAVVVLLGIGLYVWLAPDTPPIAPPVSEEAVP